MIQIIAGQKGSGKTKRLIEMTNKVTAESDKSIIFVDDDARYCYDVSRNCRFINASEYKVSSAEMFLGFLSGIVSGNYDIGTIFVDAFLKLLKIDIKDAEWFFAALRDLGSSHNVDFVLCISADPAGLPDFCKGYII